MRHTPTPLGIAGLVVAAAVLGFGGPANADPGAPIRYADSPNAVPGRYIVVFKDAAVALPAVGATVRDLTGRFGGQARHLYTAGFRGFSTAMSEQQARKLAADPAVPTPARRHGQPSARGWIVGAVPPRRRVGSHHGVGTVGAQPAGAGRSGRRAGGQADRVRLRPRNSATRRSPQRTVTS